MKAAKNPPVYMHIARYICCCIAAAYAADRRRKYKKTRQSEGEKKMEKQRKIGSLFLQRVSRACGINSKSIRGTASALSRRVFWADFSRVNH